MSSNLTIGYMAEQTNRGRLDGVAARGWLADEAATIRARSVRPARLPTMLSAALVRLGERIQGIQQTAGTPAQMGPRVPAANHRSTDLTAARLAVG